MCLTVPSPWGPQSHRAITNLVGPAAGQEGGGGKAGQPMPLSLCSVSCLNSRPGDSWLASSSLLLWVVFVPSINGVQTTEQLLPYTVLDPHMHLPGDCGPPLVTAEQTEGQKESTCLSSPSGDSNVSYYLALPRKPEMTTLKVPFLQGAFPSHWQQQGLGLKVLGPSKEGRVPMRRASLHVAMDWGGRQGS